MHDKSSSSSDTGNNWNFESSGQQISDELQINAFLFVKTHFLKKKKSFSTASFWITNHSA